MYEVVVYTEKTHLPIIHILWFILWCWCNYSWSNYLRSIKLKSDQDEHQKRVNAKLDRLKKYLKHLHRKHKALNHLVEMRHEEFTRRINLLEQINES